MVDDAPQSSRTEQRPDRPTAPRKGNVLVVDDELTVVRVYGRALKTAGFHVVTATDGEVAELMLRRCRVDAVVSDVTMPGMDGLQLIRRVHEIDPDMPVILATGECARDLGRRAVEEGALMFLEKPVDLRALAQIASHAVECRRAAQAPQGRNRRPSGAQVTSIAALVPGFEAALSKLWIAYQPIVCWVTLQIIAYEALVRSDEPGLADPAALFSAAEQLGRTLELGRAIRRRIGDDIAEAPEGAQIFVNLHPEELADDTLYSVHEPLRPHAHRVVLEVTERNSLGTVLHLADRLETLRRIGFHIALDDLGAGYAGLSSFEQLRPNVVKLDMSLTRDIDRSPVKRRIVAAVASLCRGLGVEIVAEGVETDAEREVLGHLGCDYHQGFAYGRPVRCFEQTVGANFARATGPRALPA